MMLTNPRRRREINGPTPHSVGIIARPTNKHPPEKLILDRRKHDDMLAENAALMKYNKQCDLKNDWERQTDKRIQQNTIKNRVSQLMLAQEHNLEDRRDRLRELLAKEEDNFIMEMEETQETTIERQAKMRERAKELKKKRETERLQIVQEKLDQQWRNQCEELRSTMSKRQQDLVAAERLEQLEHKANREHQLREEEKIFADLWYADMKAKAKREEEDTKRQMMANKDMLEVLNQQVAALEAKKMEEASLVEEERRLLEEQKALRKLEEERALIEKQKKYEEARDVYTKSLRLKAQREAKELQEQLAYDMKLLEELLEKSTNEAKEQAQRKKELREEDQRYRKYLEELKLQEEQREKEMEKLVDAEVEKMWQKRLQQWRLEKQARQNLLQEVLASRKQQVEDKLSKNSLRQMEAKREGEEIVRKIEENKRYEEEKRLAERSKNMHHQNDLRGQIRYNSAQRQLEVDRDEREWQSQMDAEKEYRTKLELALSKPDVFKQHPTRQAIITRNSAGLSITGRGQRSGGFVH